VEKIIKNPDEVLLDVETGNLVAVGNRISRPGHRLLVVYSPGKIIKLITVIDTSRTEIIRTREEKGRWVKMK
jgi:hypothetical protein